MTFGVSAIAAITSSVKAAGCGEVNRTRSKPSISPHARSSLESEPVADAVAEGVHVLAQNVTSLAPSSTHWRISARMSPGRRSCSLPRVVGTMQKVQVLLQPTEMATQLDTFDARSVGSWLGKQLFLHLHLRMAFDAGLVEQLRQIRCSWYRTRRRPTGLFPRSSHGRAAPCSRRPRSAGSGVPLQFGPQSDGAVHAFGGVSRTAQVFMTIRSMSWLRYCSSVAGT